ncbi:hypothetical protein BH23ACT3_BH23ACT3_21460 [soil metagenome]
MPSRKRPKSPSAVEPRDPIQRFAAALQESEARDRADLERAQRQRESAEAEARAADERAAALEAARGDLERAIERARASRRNGSGVPAADEAWRAAKARVIELETGAPPEWAHATAGVDPGDDPGDNPGDSAGEAPPFDAT